MYRNILVPLDGSAFAERALPMAIRVARATGANLVLVRVAHTSLVPGSGASEEQRRMVEEERKGAKEEEMLLSTDVWATDRAVAQIRAVEDAERYLDSIVTDLAASGVAAEKAVPYAPAAEGILVEADLHEAALIVMCTHGRSGLGRWIYGSVAEEVVGRSRIPVLLVRPTGALPVLDAGPTAAKLLAPLDGSAFGEACLPYASELAEAFVSILLLTHVVVPPVSAYARLADLDDALSGTTVRVAEEREHAEEYLGRVAGRLSSDGLRVETSVCVGWPADSILNQAQSSGATLIVMSTHGRTGLRRLLLGSVAHEVVHHTLLPVMLVPPTR